MKKVKSSATYHYLSHTILLLLNFNSPYPFSLQQPPQLLVGRHDHRVAGRLIEGDRAFAADACRLEVEVVLKIGRASCRERV